MQSAMRGLNESAPVPSSRGERSTAPDEAGVVTADCIADLAWIHEPGIQGVRLRRSPDARIVTEVEQLGREGRIGSGMRVRIDAGTLATDYPRAGFPPAPALLADIARLAELYVDLIGCPALGLRMEVLDRAMCPRFHVDAVGVRLLCTYRGPGTEWARRDVLAHRGDPQAQRALGFAEPFDVLILKGSAWPGNEGAGAVHRSPAPQGGPPPRLLLSIDAIWDE
jgi:hypothetical protein